MTIHSSSAAKGKPLPHLSIPKTVLAIGAVTLILLLISHRIVLIGFAHLVGEGSAPGSSSILPSVLSALAVAIPFVVIFGFSKEIFRGHWILYGLIWFIPIVVRWGLGFIRPPQHWVIVLLGLACSVVAYLFSAYVLKTIFR